MSGIYEKLKYKVGMASREAMFKVGMGKGLLKNRPGGRMLNYHGVVKGQPTRYNSRFTSVSDFETHLAFFKEHFHVISLEDYMSGERHKEKLTICLTFDDGYANFYQEAYPLLQKYQLPAAIFVTTIRATGRRILWTDFLDIASAYHDEPVHLAGEDYARNNKGKHVSMIDKTSLSQKCMESEYSLTLALQEVFPYTLPFNDEAVKPYWELLDEEQLKTLAGDELITIGSHGLLHTSFRYTDRYFAKEEMRDSKQWLEQVTGKEITALAYPFGHYTPDNIADAEALGYRHQLILNAARKEDKSDNRLAERLGMNPHISFENQIHCILKGRY